MAFSGNPEKNSAIIWLVISAGALMLALPFSLFLAGHFTFGRFFPVLLLPLLTFLGLIIAIALFWSSRKLDAILSGKELLARWNYAPEEIAPYAAGERKRLRKAKYLILGTCLFILILSALFAYDKNGWDYVAVLMDAALLLVVVIFLFFALPLMGYGKSSANEFYLARDGALFAGKAHFWRMFNARLEAVDFRENPATIEIAYVVHSEYGPKRIGLSVPVPKGREKEASDAAKRLGGR
ncbi:MAG: hypothetical protein PHF51_01700 [Candidatus ainarchaeum sp.]|nr:hypothetical protein [Candidatus ainarchaeum sp.]